MFVRRQLSPFAYSLPFLTPDGDPQVNPASTPPAPPADPPEVKFDDAQQRKLNDLLAAERKTTEDRVKTDLATQAATAKKKADDDRERDEATKRGDFDKVKNDLEAKVKSTEGDLATATTELDTLRAFFTTQFDAAIKDLPDVVKAFAPDAEASFETKSKWLTTAQAEAKKLDKQKPRGSGFDPPPGGDRGINQQQEVEKVRQRPAFRSL